jgi:hypothetical protein
LADAEHLGQFEPVEFVPVGEVEDGSVALGESTGRDGDEVGQFTSRARISGPASVVSSSGSMSVGSSRRRSLWCRSASFRAME